MGTKRNMQELNPMWVGDKVTYIPLHAFVRRHKLKPELCEVCNLKPPLDLANITGIYTRDFENWMYMCRSCHMKSDGRLKNLQEKKPKVDHSNTICLLCNKSKTKFCKTRNRYQWYHYENGYMCDNCYNKKKRKEARK